MAGDATPPVGLRFAQDKTHEVFMKRYRHTQILALLETRSAIRATEAAEMLGVSVGTIRRDMAELEAGGYLNRTHGGAFAAIEGEAGFMRRTCWNRDKKRVIGQAAAAHISSGSVVFIDGGTTPEAMLPFLVEKTSLTVVTCGLNIALQLLRWPYISTILLGGEVHAESRTVTGTLPVTQLDSFGMRFDMAVIATAGISAEHGATNRMLERLALKQLVLRNSASSILVGDSSKVDCAFLGRVAPLSAFSLCIMDDDLTDEQKAKLSEAGRFEFVPLEGSRRR
jgi:DeoR/GlpR family transcriptional regulator of sugar metabolism